MVRVYGSHSLVHDVGVLHPSAPPGHNSKSILFQFPRQISEPISSSLSIFTLKAIDCTFKVVR